MTLCLRSWLYKVVPEDKQAQEKASRGTDCYGIGSLGEKLLASGQRQTDQNTVGL